MCHLLSAICHSLTPRWGESPREPLTPRWGESPREPPPPGGARVLASRCPLVRLTRLISISPREHPIKPLLLRRTVRQRNHAPIPEIIHSIQSPPGDAIPRAFHRVPHPAHRAERYPDWILKHAHRPRVHREIIARRRTDGVRIKPHTPHVRIKKLVIRHVQNVCDLPKQVRFLHWLRIPRALLDL